MAHPPLALFVGDAPGLDFLNTVATPVDVPFDWIKNGTGLLRWLEEARLVPAETLAQIRAQFPADELDKVADEAKALREWFRGFVQVHKGRPLAARDLESLEPLNRVLTRDDKFSRITFTDRGLALSSERRWQSPQALLLPIAEALARLVCEENFTNVRACEGPACTLLFVDHTRGRARRWCSMALCGNRAKQAAHRHRVKARREPRT